MITIHYQLSASFKLNKKNQLDLDGLEFIQGKDNWQPQYVNHGTLTAARQQQQVNQGHQVSPQDSSTSRSTNLPTPLVHLVCFLTPP